jgi:DNA polymerase III delta prime subunit
MDKPKVTESSRHSSCRAAKQSNNRPTLLSAIESVVASAKDSQLSDQFFIDRKVELKFLADSYGITPRQAAFFCVCMEKGPRRIDFDDLASFLDLSTIRILSYASDIDALVHRRLLRYRDVRDEDQFDVPTTVIKTLKHNEVYQLPKRTGLDASSMMEYMNMWFEDLDNDAVSARELMEEMKAMIDENPQVALAQKIKAHDLLNDEDILMLLFFCHKLINEDDDDIRFGQLEDLFPDKADFGKAKKHLRCGDHYLMEDGLIEHLCVDGIADNTRYKLTEEAKRDLLGEFHISGTDEKLSDVLLPENVNSKELFYNDSVGRHVEELTSLLGVEQYKEIHKRMEQRGFRQGFTCLFHGGPGTGKTETVYQLARRTGRQVMVVDVPQIKSKWVGESEKNIKALFDRYRALVAKLDVAPILLFNEADAIIGIRKQGAQNAVDKMENTIQNIILQEMETLDGILIATTNLTENLDSAFERRFLYKIRFEKPDATVRSKIWQTMIPDLPENITVALAERYDFSGGQIENIARKYAVSCILHGDAKDPQRALEELCTNERIVNHPNERKIGFAK